jgi:uncharacterized membrane protein
MFEEASRVLFGCFCHQDPSILLTIDGQLVHLCPRCIGLHLGFIAAFIAASLWFRRGLVLSRMGTRLLLLLAVASLAFDWGVGGRLGLYAPATHSRLLTGLACGSALGVLLVAYRSSLWTISIDAARSAAPLVVAGVMSLSLAVGLLAATFSGWTLLTSLCAVSVLANVVLVLETAVRMLRVRLRLARCVPVKDASYSEGGVG